MLSNPLDLKASSLVVRVCQ